MGSTVWKPSISFPNAFLQLVELAVPGPVTEIGPHAETLLLGLAQEQRDVGRVAGVEEDVGLAGAQLGDQRAEVRGLDREAFLEDDLHALLLGLGLVGGGHPGAVRPVLVDDRHAQILGRLLEPLLRVAGDVLHRVGAEQAAVGLGPERVLEIAIHEHAVGDGGGDPQELLLLVDLLGQRDGVGTRVDAGQDVDLLDVQQPLGLVDGDLGLRLAVAVDLHDLVLAQHATALVDEIDHHLGAAPAVERAGGRERTRVVEEHADLDGLALGVDARHDGGNHDDRHHERERQQDTGGFHRDALLRGRKSGVQGITCAGRTRATHGPGARARSAAAAGRARRGTPTRSDVAPRPARPERAARR